MSDAIPQEVPPPPPPIGHNSVVADTAKRLLSIVERVERLTEEKKALGSDISDIFKEAKSNSFDVKVVRQLIRLRGMNPVERDAQDHLLDVYKNALGM